MKKRLEQKGLCGENMHGEFTEKKRGKGNGKGEGKGNICILYSVFCFLYPAYYILHPGAFFFFLLSSFYYSLCYSLYYSLNLFSINQKILANVDF